MSLKLLCYRHHYRLRLHEFWVSNWIFQWKMLQKKKLLLPSTRWSTEKYLFYEGEAEGLIRGLGCRRGRRRGRDLWHNINAWNYGFGWKMMKRHTSCTCLFIHRIFITRGGGRCKRIYGTLFHVFWRHSTSRSDGYLSVFFWYSISSLGVNIEWWWQPKNEK